jgi:hypothetical protein
MKDLILVTGAQRAGVSILGGALWACGARGGRFAQAKVADGRGGFENTEIRDCLVRPFLEGLGCDPRGQSPVPKTGELWQAPDEVVQSWRRTVLRIWDTQTPGADVNFYCSTLSALVWPMWTRAFPEAKWLFVRRNPEEIVRACLQTAWMDGYQDAAGWAGWVSHYNACFDGIAERAPSVSIYPHASQGREQGMAEMESAITALGLEWDPVRVYDLLAPVLWWRKGSLKTS